jgi:hypothetical protein
MLSEPPGHLTSIVKLVWKCLGTVRAVNEVWVLGMCFVDELDGLHVGLWQGREVLLLRHCEACVTSKSVEVIRIDDLVSVDELKVRGNGMSSRDGEVK